MSCLRIASWTIPNERGRFPQNELRYVRNLLEGRGLVFNPGEYVEGYSNFLWILELAAIWALSGIPPEQAAPWLSVVLTAGTVAAVAWWIARLPALPHRGLTAWMAFGFLCSSATFAVWTSGGGLETRQFTFFVVLAVVCLSLHRSARAGLLAASASLAAAALTRPEGPLIAAVCFGWFVIQRAADNGRLKPDWRELACLAAPFVIVVAAHYLFRYAYYGEWLPNTYYAKHVRPWYESGFRYLWAAALETGLYLLIPFAAVAARDRWRAFRDGTGALILLLVGVHMAYVMRIGGDHFEYRPLDFYWPLVAVPAAIGIVRLGSRVAAWSASFAPPSVLAMGARTWSIVIFAPALFYAGAVQAVLLFEGAEIRERIMKLHIELDDDNAGWLLAAPGMPLLVAISNDLRREAARQSVGSPFTEHREFANVRLRQYKPYEEMERGTIPDDAVTAWTTIGIPSYYLPDLKVVDKFGLTDATIARNPVTKPNRDRVIAHDRRPPPGYLRERGVNFTPHPAASSESEAFRRAPYALKVGQDLWMPFDAVDRQWVSKRFSGQRLRVRDWVSTTDASGNRWGFKGALLVGERFIGRFEDGFEGWSLEGEAITNHAGHGRYPGQSLVHGNVGPGFLTSYHPHKGDRAVGRAFSPAFTVESGQYLVFMIAGGKGVGVGLRLLADGVAAAVWRGRNTERFERIVHPLDAVAGSSLQLELFDDETGGWGHVMLDHVVLARRIVDDPE